MTTSKKEIDKQPRTFCELINNLEESINRTRSLGYFDKDDEHQIAQVEDVLYNIRGYCKRKYKK